LPGLKKSWNRDYRTHFSNASTLARCFASGHPAPRSLRPESPRFPGAFLFSQFRGGVLVCRSQLEFRPLVRSEGALLLWRCEGKMTSKIALSGWSIHSYDAQSDEDLIKAIAAGNQSAMHTLYGRHHLRVYHFIVRLGCDTDRAEDVVAEVFLSVWRQAGTFESRSQVRRGCCRSHDSKPSHRSAAAERPNLKRARWRRLWTTPIIPNHPFFTVIEACSYGAVLGSCPRITARSLILCTTTTSRSMRSQRF
jgi:hypothetical protein